MKLFVARCIWRKRQVAAPHVLPYQQPGGVEGSATRARQEGQDVTCESCPHYFVLDTDQFEEIKQSRQNVLRHSDQKTGKGMGKLLNGEIDSPGIRPLHALRK